VYTTTAFAPAFSAFPLGPPLCVRLVHSATANCTTKRPASHSCIVENGPNMFECECWHHSAFNM